MFKKLDPQDIVVAGQPVIEPAGSDPGGVCDVNTEYEVYQTDLAGVGQYRYRQLANIIQGDATSNLPIGATGYAAVFKRNNFKEALHPGTCRIGISADDSFKTGSHQVVFTEAGRQYESVSGKGYLYPDIGVILSTELANIGTNITANSEITATNSQVFIRVGASEFNYTTNPSFLSKDDQVRSPDLIYNPRTYITTVGLYNDNGDLLAVAKVPKPIEKSFEKEVLITIELNY